MSKKSSSRSYSNRDRQALFGRSAYRCAECRELCHVDSNENDGYVLTAKIGHIVASSDDGPRGDPSFPIENRDKYDNLILLCGGCHDKIDGQPNTFSTGYLREKKQSHEEWIDNQLADGIAAIVFTELDFTLTALASNGAAQLVENFTLTPPREKLRKNDLSGDVQQLVASGMMRDSEVASFISDIARLDYTFPDRLITGFRAEYDRLVEEDFGGDELFYALLEFASLKNPDFRRRAIGLAILTHLFILCEVFQP